MPRAVLAVAMLALVVTAGCLTADTVGTEPVDAEETTEAAPFTIPDRTVDPATSPWGRGPITVAVDDRTGWERDVRPEVRETLRFWENAVYPSDHYRPEFELVENASRADVRVEVVTAVDQCGVHDDVMLGCAPVVPTDATVTDEVTVQVRAGHAPATTRLILQHEFGHVLGFRHGEGPADVMSQNLSARAPAGVVDAADRTYPWGSDELAVAVDADDEKRAAALERVRRALAYYERGAHDTVANPPSFEVVEDTSEADLVVSLRESVGCDVYGAAMSCADWDGPDVDDDRAPEYYTDGRVVVASDGHDRVGWHLGYWLGRTLWTDGVPEPFRTSEKPPAGAW